MNGGKIMPRNPEKNAEISRVSGFKEKPAVKEAEDLIKNGALWNCGVFVFKLRYVMDILRNAINFISYGDVVRQYKSLAKTSFDYAVAEKCDSIYVVRYDGEWSDIGTWNTLTEVMSSKPIGDARIADDCVNTHVINELDIPMLVLGAKDMIIAASPDGILVADKEQSSYMKKYVDEINRRPMYEEKLWGEYKVLDLTVNEDGTKALTKRKRIKAGASIEYQSHKFRSEVWTVINGKCIISINGCAQEALPGHTFTIAESTGHGLTAITDTEILEIQFGKELTYDATEF